MQLRHRPKRLISHATAALLALTLSLTHPTAQAEDFGEYDLLLLDFTWKKQILAQSVSAYTLNDTVVISLAEAAAALEFPISVDTDSGTASGWFLDEERHFELDINTETVTIDGKTIELEPEEAIVHEYSIYVPLETFSRWFPVNLTLDMSTLSVKTEGREALPVQLRAERRQLVGRRFVMSPPSLPEVDVPYQLVGPHTADILLGYYIRRETKPKPLSPTTSLTHSILLKGDLAYMGSAIYLYGNDDDTLVNARMTLSRERPDTPPGISRLELGDIIPTSLPGVSSGSLERGLSIAGDTQGKDLSQLDGNRTNISGDLMEGWEIELLHNGIRIDYQIAGTEGRYDFRNLELYHGANTFELIFYGPAGERRTETIIRHSGINTISKGNLNYQFTTTQKGKGLYEPDNQTLGITDKGTGRYTARLDYALTSNLSIGSGWHSLVENGARLNYYSARARMGWHGIYTTLEATRDAETDELLWDGSIHAPFTMELWGFNTKFQHTQYANSVYETDDTTDLKITSRSSIILSSRLGKASGRFSSDHNRLIQGSTTRHTLDLSYQTSKTRIGNSIYQDKYSGLASGEKASRTSGNLYFNHQIKPLDLRGNILYQVKPETEATQYQLNSDLYVAHDMSMFFGLDHTPLSNNTIYTAGMNWKLKYATLSPRLSYDSNGIYTGFILVNLSMSPKPDRFGLLLNNRPTASTGGVVGRVFEDRNNDGLFGTEDKPLPGVSVFAPQAYRHADTDEHGSAYLMTLRPNKATDIKLDQNTLPDITMRSFHEGNSVRPRAAQWTIIDFPVTSTGEIDGTLYRQSDKQREPQPGMLIELRDANNDLADFKISGQDGFFLFEHVPYGKYTISLAEANRSRLIKGPIKVKLNNNNPTHFGAELVIQPIAKVQQSLIPSSIRRAITPSKPPAKTAPLAPIPIQALPPSSPPATGTHALQLGAFSSQTSAEAAITAWRLQFSKQLNNLELKVRRIRIEGRGTFYRVHATGTLSESQAKARCQQLMQAGQNCYIVEQKINN